MKPGLPAQIAVSGLTGAGKSTLVRALAPLLGYEALVEDVSANPYLKPFFANPRRFAFPLQMWFLQYRYHEFQRIERLIRHGQIKGCLFDRTLWDGLAFVRALTQVGRLDPIEAQTYYQVFAIASQNVPPPSLVVFLECRSDTAHGRVLGRGTPGEDQSLTRDYLEILRIEYARLVGDWERQGARVLSLNGDRFHDPRKVGALLGAGEAVAT